MMSLKGDQLRSRLPRLAAELDEAVHCGLVSIYRAANAMPHEPLNEAERQRDADWRKGLRDALTMMQSAQLADRRFRDWLNEVIAQEVDHCGLTRAEREELLGQVMQAR
jgi:hypothetical protein